MYGIIVDVLNRGGYDLKGITDKINALWVEGKLTDEERSQLLNKAQGNADSTYSVDVMQKLNDLEQRVRAIENNEVTNTEETVADFVDGKWYYNGDKCTFKGKTYVCTAPDGVVCVWSPEAYPAYWSEV